MFSDLKLLPASSHRTFYRHASASLHKHPSPSRGPSPRPLLRTSISFLLAGIVQLRRGATPPSLLRRKAAGQSRPLGAPLDFSPTRPLTRSRCWAQPSWPSGQPWVACLSPKDGLMTYGELEPLARSLPPPNRRVARESWLPCEFPPPASPGLAGLCHPVPWVSSSLSPWERAVVPQFPPLSTLGSIHRELCPALLPSDWFCSLVFDFRSLSTLLPSAHPGPCLTKLLHSCFLLSLPTPWLLSL